MNYVPKLIPLLLFFLTSSAQICTGEDQVSINDLSLTIKFYYALNKDMEQEVLFLDKIVKNTGKSALIFSFYPADFYLSDIGPKKLLETTGIVSQGCVPSPPTVADIVRLGPGEKFTSTSWFWADGYFPYPSTKKGAEKLIYMVPDKTEIQVGLCIDLTGPTESLDKFLKPGETLLKGTLCSNKTKFLYKLLLKEEE
jgi:hypothetical protein